MYVHTLINMDKNKKKNIDFEWIILDGFRLLLLLIMILLPFKFNVATLCRLNCVILL